jgi:hypothetical protein
VATWRLAVLVSAAVAVIAAGTLAVENLHTTASAWRSVDPSANGGPTLILPAKRPAQDRHGADGWVWPDGTPGWQPGQRMKGFLVAGLQPADVQQVRKKAPALVDGGGLRVVDATRASRRALLAILAAPAATNPKLTCLSVMLHRDAPVRWLCPNAVAGRRGLDRAPVLVAASSLRLPQMQNNAHPLYVIGVARGDVRRVVLTIPGWPPETLYRRGQTWGQFDAARAAPDGSARLHVYGRSGLLATVRLAVGPGQARVFR